MRHRAVAIAVAVIGLALTASTGGCGTAAGRLQRDPRVRAREPDGEPARRQQLVVQAFRRASRAGGPRARHVRRHVRQLAGAVAAALRQRLLRVRAQLRLLQRQRLARRVRHRQDRGLRRAALRRFVNQVLAATGAHKVDIVGHSQGGMMPRYYIKNLGGASKVNTLVGLAPSNHGTTLEGLFTLASYFPGGSSFVGADCPGLPGAGGRIALHHEPQRRRRDRPRRQLHGDRVRQRRGRHALHLGVPGAGRTSRTSCCRASARSTRASICRCPTTTSPTPTC